MILLLTAFLQVGVVLISGSVALLADTIHNFADAATAIPLGIAFMLCRLKPTKRFSYGYGRVEDLAGMTIVLIILFSAIVAGYETINRFFHPQIVTHLGAVIVASIIGFIGNESVAVFRIRVGKEIKSAALIADGYHARTDGWMAQDPTRSRTWTARRGTRGRETAAVPPRREGAWELPDAHLQTAPVRSAA